MPPRPDCTYEFDLPHGFDTVQKNLNHDSDQESDKVMEDILSNTEFQDTQDYHKPSEAHHNTSEHQNLQPSQRVTEHNVTIHDPNNALDQRSPKNNDGTKQYSVFEKGFSDDDEEVDASWNNNQTRASQRQQQHRVRSQRRLSDIGNEENNQRRHKPPYSLFGGPAKETSDASLEKNLANCNPGTNEPQTPRDALRDRISTFHLHHQNEDRSSSERSFQLGFGLDNSDIDSTSREASSPPSDDESIVITPDDKVSR